MTLPKKLGDKPLLLIGASVRALMESAVESGYEATGIDFYGDADSCLQGQTLSLSADCGLKPTVKNLFKIASAFHGESLVYASGPENFPEELIDWENRGQLKGNGPSILKQVRVPSVLRQSVELAHGKMPLFYSVAQWKQTKNVKTKQNVKTKWLLKQINRGGGQGITDFPQTDVETSALISNLAEPEKYIIQEYIEGISGSVTFLANGQETSVLGTSRQLIGSREEARPFVYQGNIVPLDVRKVMPEEVFGNEIRTMINRLTQDFGLKGINTLDFIINHDGIWILEINPRWSASVELIEKYLGRRVFADHLAVCDGADLDSAMGYTFCEQTLKPIFCGKLVVYAHDSGEIRTYQEQQLRYLYERGIRDIPRPGTVVHKGQPLCTVLGDGSTDRECMLNLQKKAVWVQRHLVQRSLNNVRLNNSIE